MTVENKMSCHRHKATIRQNKLQMTVENEMSCYRHKATIRQNKLLMTVEKVMSCHRHKATIRQNKLQMTVENEMSCYRHKATAGDNKTSHFQLSPIVRVRQRFLRNHYAHLNHPRWFESGKDSCGIIMHTSTIPDGSRRK